MSMVRSLDKDAFIEILNRGINSASIQCDFYLKQNDFKTASWMFIKEIAIIFRENGYPRLSKDIESSITIEFKIQEALEKIQETEELRKFIEKIFIEVFC